MIYSRTTDGMAFLIIEQTNIDKLRGGKPMITPDRSIVVFFTPDMKFTEEQIHRAIFEGVLDIKMLAEIVDIGKDRKVITR